MRRTNARKFGRIRKVRKALMRSLAYALISKGKIETTEAKAKSLRPFVEKLITEAKKGTPASHRLVGSRVGVKAVPKIFKDIAPKYKTRAGGYTRIIKTAIRRSDGAKMAVIELV